MTDSQIINANNSEALKSFDENSIDSVVTDPPYGLSFMGKKWDYDVPTTEFWAEVLRVLKPGGHLLSFSGARTYHRMVVNVEDAGFEIRDQIMWIYGSGFPKSLNVGKAVDKLLGTPREFFLRNDGKYSDSGSGTYQMNNGKSSMAREFVDSKGSSKFEGWGTCLKPAHEPIVVARKPIQESVAKNSVKWGVGGINIHDCKTDGPGEGRFPANIIHDGSECVETALGKSSCFFYSAKASTDERKEKDSNGMPHPTVKPVELMRYLTRLVTPKGGLCLDPFNGSGTTAVACRLEGFDYIGIEVNPDYCAMTNNRLNEVVV